MPWKRIQPSIAPVTTAARRLQEADDESEHDVARARFAHACEMEKTR